MNNCITFATMKAIIFTRVSTEAQDLDQQRTVLINEAHRLGYDDLEFIEHKESAISNTIEQREGISELVERLPNADAVFVWEISRLARRADVIYYLRDRLLETHTQLICITPPFHLLDNNGKLSPTASLVMSIFTSLAESEMMIKKERMKRGLRQRIEQGYYHGGPNPLFGYRPNKDKRMELDPETAPVVRKVFEMYVTGEWTFRSLGIHLRDAGLFKPISNSSCLSKVHDIINDSRYVGTREMYPPIISIELWEKAQQRARDAVQAAKTKNSHEMLLKKIIRSKKSGKALGCIPSNKMYQSPTDEQPMLFVPQRAVDGPIYELAVNLHKKFFTNPAARQRKLLDELKIIDKKFRTAAEECATIQERIDRLEERVIIGNISEARANELLNKFKTQLSEATERKNLYEREAREKGQQMYDDYWREDNGAYDNLSYREKREIILSTIECIYATRSQEDSRYVLLEIHTIHSKDPLHGKNILHLKIQTRKYFKHINED